jgi:hypothetical protein
MLWTKKIFLTAGKNFLQYILRDGIYHPLKICQVIFLNILVAISFLKYLHPIYTDGNIQYHIV